MYKAVTLAGGIYVSPCSLALVKYSLISRTVRPSMISLSTYWPENEENINFGFGTSESCLKMQLLSA